MTISVEDLKLAVERARHAASEAGELHPARRGALAVQLPDAVREAVARDLASGEYERAATEAIAGDSELTLS